MQQHTSKASAAATVIVSACVVPAAAPAGDLAPTIQAGNIGIELQLVADGITSPVKVVHAGDGSGRLFIVDQVGLVHVVDNGVLLSTPFLDIIDQLPVLNTGFDERGLLGLAFHPDYENNGRLFARYSVPRPGFSNEPCFGTSRGCHRERVAEFAVTGDPNVADPTPTVLFEVDEPEFNHDGGDIIFGPDGMLYFGLGDGGGANDGLDDDPPPHGPIGHGQNIETALGAMIRIDVDNIPDDQPYGIPADNVFVGVPGLDEIYAWGFRNPFRFSFDRDDGRLFVADVGQALFEEINIVEAGGNYGWVIREGFHCFDPFDSSNPPANCADVGMNGEPLLDPVTEYDHDDGISITGGFVYRGTESPNLEGLYIFGDFSQSFAPADGRVFYMDSEGTAPIPIFEFALKDRGLPLGEYVIGFGEDEAGEGYLCTTTNLAPVGNAGQVYKIVGVIDFDEDGELDASDNCWQLANPDQRDTDGDSIGNRCDPDIAIPNDNVVNFADLAVQKAAFFSTPADANWNPDADLDGDDSVGFDDLGITKEFFFGAPGPGFANP